jgi:hypothetical protein
MEIKNKHGKRKHERDKKYSSSTPIIFKKKSFYSLQ